jgi:geranylgeranyl diphosphate synthase type I
MTTVAPPEPSVSLWPEEAALRARLAPVHALMRSTVSPDEATTDGLYRWLRYHLGWASATGAPEDARTGKGIRPLVCLAACEAMGADPAAAVTAAAAVELTHEFSLVHDDLEDGDTLRRGRPTLWTVIGAPQAINAGDALFAIARGLLVTAPLPAGDLVDVMARYDAACLALAEGQYLDIAFEQRSVVQPDEYVAMVRRKTGALLGLAAALGARCGGGDDATAEALMRYGEAVGVAFQMQDDVLGLWGVPGVTGKPAGADLMRGKKSLPVILALADPTLSPALSAFLATSTRSASEAENLAALMEARGHRSTAIAEARRWSATAVTALGTVALRAEPQRWLAALAEAAVARDR